MATENTSTNATENAKKATKKATKKRNNRVKKNLAVLVTTFSKEAIDLLVEYCEIDAKIDDNINIDFFKDKVITELDESQIKDYLKAIEQIKLKEDRNKKLEDLVNYGITINAEANKQKQEEDKAKKEEAKTKKEEAKKQQQ